MVIMVKLYAKSIPKYREISFLMSIIPFIWGDLARRYFYESTLISVGTKSVFSFGCVIEGRNCRIGDSVYIGPYSYIYNNIEIGNNVMLAPRVTIMDGRNQHSFSNNNKPMIDQEGVSKKVTIGNDVWIGNNSCITEDIASHCIVGTNSLVLKSTKEYEIVAGNPARVIKIRK
jgi:acetyltransferase-like isoleucine patch superfamily enzyme